MAKKIDETLYLDKIKEIYLGKNVNIKVVAKELGISFSTVYRILIRNNIKKSKELKHICKVNAFKKYGKAHWDKRNQKNKIVLQRRYGKGVINPSQIPGMQEKTHLKSAIIKANNTKRKNHTFKTSSPEDKIFLILTKRFKEVFRNYNTKIYPFNCDFYIPELDLYIEYQGHWTHGFDGSKLIGPFVQNAKCNAIKQKWLEKAKTSKFYEKALEVWLTRDPLKRETAKKNHLNWIEFFNMQEFENWFENLSANNSSSNKKV